MAGKMYRFSIRMARDLRDYLCEYGETPQEGFRTILRDHQHDRNRIEGLEEDLRLAQNAAATNLEDKGRYKADAQHLRERNRDLSKQIDEARIEIDEAKEEGYKLEEKQTALEGEHQRTLKEVKKHFRGRIDRAAEQFAKERERMHFRCRVGWGVAIVLGLLGAVHWFSRHGF